MKESWKLKRSLARFLKCQAFDYVAMFDIGLVIGALYAGLRNFLHFAALFLV